MENNCSRSRSQEQPKESVGQFGGVLDESTINPQDSFGVDYDYQLSRTAQFIVTLSLTERVSHLLISALTEHCRAVPNTFDPSDNWLQQTETETETETETNIYS